MTDRDTETARHRDEENKETERQKDKETGRHRQKIKETERQEERAYQQALTPLQLLALTPAGIQTRLVVVLTKMALQQCRLSQQPARQPTNR